MPEGTTFVQPFPPTGTKHQIGQGAHPLWSRDGKELFFIPGPGRFQVVTVSTQPSFTFTRPVAVPRVFAVAHPALPRPYDVLPDGRFIGIGVPDPGPGGPQIYFVLQLVRGAEGARSFEMTSEDARLKPDTTSPAKAGRYGSGSNPPCGR